MVSRREFIVTCAVAAASQIPNEVRADGQDLRCKKIDRRNSSSPVEYLLMFTARVSGTVVEWPGHAYMMVGEYDVRDKVCRFDGDKTLGFYPADDASVIKTYLAKPVPAKVGADLKKELNQKLITHRLDILVAEDGYAAATKAAAKYLKDKPYQAGETDCVGLMEEVLNALLQATEGAKDKLSVPDKARNELPKTYLDKVLKANGLSK